MDNSPKFIKMEYETDCGGQFSTLRKRNYCNDIQLGTTVDFYVNVTLTDYPTDGVYVSTKNTFYVWYFIWYFFS